MVTRIFLGDLRRLTRELLTRVAETRSDLVIVGEHASGEGDLIAAADAAGADLIVLGYQADPRECPLRLLERHPPKGLLLIRDDGRDAVHCRPLGELSPQALLDAVR